MSLLLATIHLLLDCPVGGQIGYLWPLSIDIYKYCPDLISGYMASLDAIILVIWLIHEEVHKNIRVYFFK